MGETTVEDLVLHGDFDADAAELTLGFDLQFFEFLRGHEGGMRVQGAHGAVDGAINQVFGGFGFGVLVLNEGQGLGENLQLGADAGRFRGSMAARVAEVSLPGDGLIRGVQGPSAAEAEPQQQSCDTQKPGFT